MKKNIITTLRRISVIFISLFFVASYRADIQILEGSLSGSRFIGIHLIDPFVTLQVIAAHNSIPVNLIIGTVVIIIFYLVVGGRAFCSWVCPYGLLSEFGEKLHLLLLKHGIVKGESKKPFSRYWFFAIWIGLSFSTGLLIFEIFNVVGILSRFLIYGWSFAIFFVLLVLLGEIFFIRRFWCRGVCPVGSAYGLLNLVSAGGIYWNGKCDNCGKCVHSCIEQGLLSFTLKSFGEEKTVRIGSPDCTLCGCCIEVCPKGCFSYKNRIKNLV